MTSGFRGSIAMCPLSPPPTDRQSSYGVRPPIPRLGREIVLLSCCDPYTRYGNCSSTKRRYISAVAWLYIVDQDFPPLWVICAPPSFPMIIVCGSSGLIHRSWVSPCGTWICSNVFPPSIDFQKRTLRTYTVFSSPGSAYTWV